MIFDPDALTLAQAGERIGVPAVQLARWCADGSIARETFTGSPRSPGRIRFSPDVVDELREAVAGGHFNPPEGR